MFSYPTAVSSKLLLTAPMFSALYYLPVEKERGAAGGYLFSESTKFESIIPKPSYTGNEELMLDQIQGLSSSVSYPLQKPLLVVGIFCVVLQ